MITIRQKDINQNYLLDSIGVIATLIIQCIIKQCTSNYIKALVLKLAETIIKQRLVLLTHTYGCGQISFAQPGEVTWRDISTHGRNLHTYIPRRNVLEDSAAKIWDWAFIVQSDYQSYVFRPAVSVQQLQISCW